MLQYLPKRGGTPSGANPWPCSTRLIARRRGTCSGPPALGDEGGKTPSSHRSRRRSALPPYSPRPAVTRSGPGGGFLRGGTDDPQVALRERKWPNERERPDPRGEPAALSRPAFPLLLPTGFRGRRRCRRRCRCSCGPDRWCSPRGRLRTLASPSRPHQLDPRLSGCTKKKKSAGPLIDTPTRRAPVKSVSRASNSPTKGRPGQVCADKRRVAQPLAPSDGDPGKNRA